MNIQHDYVFGSNKLYYRKKIIFFDKIETICIYFKLGLEFATTPELDYFEIMDIYSLNCLKELLSKESIKTEDLFKIIELFDNKMFIQNIKDLDASKIYSNFNYNDLYFSL